MARGRFTEADLALLEGNLAAQAPDRILSPPSLESTVLPPRKPKAALPENQVEQQICDFLRARRWVVRRQHVGKHVPLGFLLRTIDAMKHVLVSKQLIFRNVVQIGETGMADWRAERAAGPGGLMQVLYVEVKAAGKKPSLEQHNWLVMVRLSGALGTWSDSIDSFQRWYEANVKDLR